MTHTPTPPQADPGTPWAGSAIHEFLNHRAAAMGAGSWASPAREGTIPLTGGVPDPDALPTAALLEATRTVLAREAAPALEYGGNYGFPGLRELVAAEVDPQPGLGYGVDNVALTSGSAHALHNILDTFLNPGDTVVIETPAWGGIIRHLRGAGAVIEEVGMDEHGILIPELDELLTRLAAEGRRPKLIYTIPTFQNPMGITSTHERRKALIEVAARHRVLILEDDPYGELRFSGAPVPSILSLAGGDGVIRCGSFSKIIATGLRVGWIQASREYVDAVTRMRFDNGTSPFTSRIIAAYLEAGNHQPHLAKMRAIYKAKCDGMLSALEESCSGLATWTHPEGGFFIWLSYPASTDPKALAAAASDEGVQFIPGASFFAKGGGQHSLRLCFSYLSENVQAEAIRRLARALEKAR